MQQLHMMTSAHILATHTYVLMMYYNYMHVAWYASTVGPLYN